MYGGSGCIRVVAGRRLAGKITTDSPPAQVHTAGMSFRVSVPRWLALAAAITLALPGTGGCSTVKPPPAPKCGGDDPCFYVDDFVCISGGCQSVIERDCIECGLIWVTYSTEDITAKSGRDYVGVQSGRIEFPAGVKSATVNIETLSRRDAQPATFRLVVAVDGAVVSSGVGTIPGT